jgi:hypothetical protein
MEALMPGSAATGRAGLPAGRPPVAATMPARWVPLLYFALAHLSLATALAALVLEPRSLAGFFYHPRMVAVVHLVTLGWISASILGAIYMVGPLAFRMPLPARFGDYAALAAYAVAVVGLVGHFWMDLPSGMAWAAGLAATAMTCVAARVLLNLWAAPAPLEARLPMALAFMNIIIAAGLGVLLAINKVVVVLTAPHLDVVFAHAHLAAVGWATMMVVGAGYRVLPMMLPAAMPRGAWAFAGPILIEAGLLGLFWSFLRGGRLLGLFASVVVAGIGVFLSRVVWMLRHRRPAPAPLRRPDWGVAHALQALACLIAACGLGLYLAVAERSETTLALAWVYGVLGLVGFLAQIIVGVEARLLPLFAWLWGFADRGYTNSPPSLHAAPSRLMQGVVFGLWTLAVPLLAFGLASNRIPLVSLAAAALLLAVVTGFANAIVVLARLWRYPGVAKRESEDPLEQPGNEASRRGLYGTLRAR